ncbi:ABC transporter ATP-binding protein [Brenneria corticis]|uniref:Protein tyrosine phosphatase n=1 Tax=Brenneria corticis TaxID=2173106 RepID=A0A2U1TYQ0_9GAMM|nr:ABC transporter ATP-binding protein [Brenneria sp. CFCC 11842]PWC14531.1 protein tyrosine phosphatase [Brenneria sp. CFCC 11842]
MNSRPLLYVGRVFLPYLAPQRGLLWGSLGALLFATAMRLLEPWPLAVVIDAVLTTDAAAAPRLMGMENWSKTALLWFCAGGVVAIAALKAAMSYLSTLGLALVGSRVLGEVRRDLFSHLLNLPLSFHHRARTGDLTMRLINDIGMLREVTVTALMPMLASLLILTGMFGVMLYLDWRLALIALLPMPFLLWRSRRAARNIHEVSRQQRRREGKLAAKAAEFIGAISTVQALGLESAAIKSFGDDNMQSSLHNVRSKRLEAGLERSVDLVIALATALVLVCGASSVLSGRLSPGDLIIFLSYLKNSFRPVREYAKYTGRLSKALAAGERVVDLLERRSDIVDGPHAAELNAAAGDIRFENICFGYQATRDGAMLSILDGFSLHAPAGRSVAIAGPSGAGKSTISSLLLRLYDPQSGAVELDGRNLGDYTISSLRRQISVVPQDSLLLGVSIRENIALAAQRPVSEQEIIAAARLANAHEFITALPHGYDTVISEGGQSLSGGQRQRISIARAAIRRTPILILDEPNVGLDSENERDVTEALLRLMRGRTSLLITHNLSFAARADHIVFLEQGRIVEQGSHDQLIAAGGRYAQLWQLQRRENER